MRLKPGVRSALVVMLILVVAFIGMINSPPYKRFVVLSKQGECHSYLRMIGEWEQDYFAKHGEFTESAEVLGAKPEQNYAYVIGKTVLLPTVEKSDRLVERIPASIRQTLHVDKDSFMIACVADLDGDEFVDVFTVSSHPRTIGIHTVEAGRVFQNLDDVLDEVEQ